MARPNANAIRNVVRFSRVSNVNLGALCPCKRPTSGRYPWYSRVALIVTVRLRSQACRLLRIRPETSGRTCGGPGVHEMTQGGHDGCGRTFMRWRRAWNMSQDRCADVTRAKRRLSASRPLPHDHNRPTRQLLPLPVLADRTAVCRYVIVAN